MNELGYQHYLGILCDEINKLMKSVPQEAIENLKKHTAIA